MNKRLFTASLLASGLFGLAALPGTALAQDNFPSKSVRWIVPYAAGGGSDFLARTIGQIPDAAQKRFIAGRVLCHRPVLPVPVVDLVLQAVALLEIGAVARPHRTRRSLR